MPFFILIHFKLETHAPANTFSSLFRSGFGFFSLSSSSSSLFSCILYYFFCSMFLFFSVRHVIYVNGRLFVSCSPYRQMHAPLADMCGEKAFYHCQCDGVVVATAQRTHKMYSIHSHIRPFRQSRQRDAQSERQRHACACFCVRASSRLLRLRERARSEHFSKNNFYHLNLFLWWFSNDHDNTVAMRWL